MINFSNNQKGYVVSIIVFFIMIIMLSMAITMSFLVVFRQKNTTNAVKSTQSYYAAEAGIEDALLRLKKTPQLSSLSYNNLTVNGVSVSVVISTAMGGSRNVTSQGDNNGIIKKIQTVLTIGAQNINFYYGIEVGAGGLQMSNGSRVMGNVFSNGNISGSGTIDNDVVVSGNGNSIQGVYVGGNAMTYSCLSGASVQNLTYVTGGSHTCAVRGTTQVRADEISAQPLPIPQSQIDAWKSDAAAENTINGNYSITNGAQQSLGPVKITGDLNVSNNAVLTLTGTIYVAGNINLSNNAKIKLSSSYGSLGGVLLADGTIMISNGAVFSGSGQTGSYVLVLSTNTSNVAINVSNNANGAVLYTSAGGLSISNGVSLLEATGYKVIMSNNSKIQYSSGLENIYFSNGPGGAWQVTDWQEQ